MDPRLSVIERRLAGVGRILAVGGGKGGIGKTLVASTLALAGAGLGRRTGLLDLDLTAPTAHVVLGIEPRLPEERAGVEPLVQDGVSFMSIACFLGKEPAPLRGEDVTNALLELLAITRWGELDVLVVDMPPGLGDAMLDALRLVRRAEHLAVATDARVGLETARRNLALLRRLGARVAGVLANLWRDPEPVRELARAFGAPFLGALPWDETVEAATGDPARLARTPVFAAVREVARVLL